MPGSATGSPAQYYRLTRRSLPSGTICQADSTLHRASQYAGLEQELRKRVQAGTPIGPKVAGPLLFVHYRVAVLRTRVTSTPWTRTHAIPPSGIPPQRHSGGLRQRAIGLRRRGIQLSTSYWSDMGASADFERSLIRERRRKRIALGNGAMCIKMEQHQDAGTWPAETTQSSRAASQSAQHAWPCRDLVFHWPGFETSCLGAVQPASSNT